MLFPADRNNTFPFQPYPKLPDKQSKEKSVSSLLYIKKE